MLCICFLLCHVMKLLLWHAAGYLCENERNSYFYVILWWSGSEVGGMEYGVDWFELEDVTNAFICCWDSFLEAELNRNKEF